jgi:sigma-B regulation protein RsbU (phosphoserine phosphatase)
MTDTASSAPSSERLALLCHVSQQFNSSLDLDQVLNTVMDEIIAATRAERGFVMLREDDGALVFRVARGIDQTSVDDPQFQISRGVVEQVTIQGQPVLTSDAMGDDRFSDRQSVMLLGLRSIMCAPLTVKDDVIGAVYVDNRLQAGIFIQDDLDLLAAIASSAATAIENARLYQIAVEKGRMERELQMAYKVQSSLLPQEIPQISGWEFAARWIPAREVAGDFYDFIPDEHGGLGLIIADVVDKGMPAALYMAFSRSTLRASLLRAPSPKDGITEANTLICKDSAYGMFVTLIYCLVHPESQSVTYVNAGHNPPLLFRKGTKELIELTRTGMLLGVEEDTCYTQETTHLEPGDFIFFYTDGICDALNPQEEPFGMDRLKDSLIECDLTTGDGILENLEHTIAEYTQSAAQFDDITMLVAVRR